ncbi:ABC transporter transmembrane domain-containing protein [Synechococcus sp. RSCCF101]|uniref:ABC transporter transmembrane domain-containing protein n=1 Tax=Synechococcus sp. RSCCF101 TaxID=2511069 RepID=UPI00177E0680|nr:ABC transporter transmembrane domain-containing protein [Synechococcus sp. RSCCF101]
MSTIAINLLALAVPLYINTIYVAVIPRRSTEALIVLSALLLLAFGASLFFLFLKSRVLSWYTASREHQQRVDLLKGWLGSAYVHLNDTSRGLRFRQLNSGSVLARTFEQKWIVERIDLPFAGLYLIVLLLIGHWLVLIPLAVALPASFCSWTLARQLARLERDKVLAEVHCQDVMASSLVGAGPLKDLNLEAFTCRQIESNELAESRRRRLAYASTQAALQSSSSIVSQWTQIIIVTVGGLFVINGRLTVGALAACTLLSGQVTGPVVRWIGSLAYANSARIAADLSDAVLGLPEDPAIVHDERPDVPASGELSARNLSFKLLDQDQSLSVSDLAVPVGARMLIRGGHPGHNRLLFLTLIGLHPIQSGSLTYASRPTSAYDGPTLRQRMPLLAPEYRLPGGTILEWITTGRVERLGKPAVQLCDDLGLSSAIGLLPSGYDTVVGPQQTVHLPRLLLFQLRVVSALLNGAAILLADFSEVYMSSEAINWLLALPPPCSIVIAHRNPRLPVPPMVSQVHDWQEGRLMAARSAIAQ